MEEGHLPTVHTVAWQVEISKACLLHGEYGEHEYYI